ncbi:MAG: MBL fold metallo-hydrolase [Lachnospiraceae bacterium]|nr:MBL fold metallo-hydrolase [Lachnospiraceae bacterium]
MKRILVFLLTCVMVVTLAACGGAADDDDDEDDDETPAVTTEATEAQADDTRNHQAPESTTGNLVVTFFGNLKVDQSVTWGDCTLMKMPDESYVLVDSCEGGYENYIVQQLKDEGVTHIECAFISHFHSDHYGGLMNFIDAFGIKKVYIDGFELDESISWNTNAAPLRGYIEKLQAKGVEVTTVMAGDSFEIGGAQFDILYPRQDTAGATTNDTSNVMSVSWDGKKVLFTGDLYYTGESACLAEVDNELLKADVLKIMHHGANTSGSAEFIEAVSPKVAACMGGHIMNNTGLRRYQKVGCEVYQVWETGDVHVMLTAGSDELYVWTQQ